MYSSHTQLCALFIALSLIACPATESTGEAHDGWRSDGEIDALDTGEEAGPLTIGINPTGIEDPTRFEPLASGDELTIELGFQGLWMVVLALRTDAPVAGLVTIFARVETAEETIGEFSIPKQVISAADDGRYYYLNLFLVVSGPEHSGKEATVTVEVSDKETLLLSHEVEVQLVGGELPFGSDATSAPTDAFTAPADALGPSADAFFEPPSDTSEDD